MHGTEETTATKRAVITVAIIWIATTVLAELLLSAFEFHPFGASREAEISDDAFDFLVILATPVTTFVLVVVGYSMFRYRAGSDQTTDAPPIRTHKLFITAWLVVTSALAVFVIFNPGFSGLDELNAEPDADLVIDIRAERWSWAISYPNGAQTQGALVIPVDTRIMFRVTATDVLHSFWIPAFRVKIDAVPGIETTTMLTAEEIVSFDDEPLVRLQCAELCGVGHGRMWNEVTVLSKADFEAWLQARGA